VTARRSSPRYNSNNANKSRANLQAVGDRHPVTWTTGEFFPDGTCIELLRDPKSGRATLLSYDGENSTIAPRIKTHGRVYAPAVIDPPILCALALPSRCCPYGSTRKLFTEISELISRTTRLPDGIVAQITFFVFATWFADRLPLAPLLWIVAPPTASTVPLLQLLGLVCRRALLVTGLTTTGLRSLPLQLRPTIVTEVATVTRGLIAALRASNRQGTYLAAGKKVLDISCARVIFADQPLRTAASAGFPLEIALAPSCDYVPVMDLAEAERIAANFRPKLLMYRLVNYNKLTAPILDYSELTAPTQQLAHSLAACIVGDDELQSQIARLLQPRDREIQVDRAALLESIVLEALLAACHDGQSATFPMAELTQSVNTILAGRGETLQISPEIAGWKLRALGLRTEFISGGRKGLALHPETCETVHALAAAYGVRTLRQGPSCRLCPRCAGLEIPPKRDGGEL